MKITDLIKYLQETLRLNGDLEIRLDQGEDGSSRPRYTKHIRVYKPAGQTTQFIAIG